MFAQQCVLQRSSADSGGPGADKVQEVKGQVDELKGIMVRNIGTLYWLPVMYMLIMTLNMLLCYWLSDVLT